MDENDRLIHLLLFDVTDKNAVFPEIHAKTMINLSPMNLSLLLIFVFLIYIYGPTTSPKLPAATAAYLRCCYVSPRPETS